MQRRIVRYLGGALIAGLFIAVLLLATSCGGSATPTSIGTSSEATTAPSASPPSITLGTGSPTPAWTGGRLKFERITSEMGLSQNSVFCMLQDSQGFMWFGTEDGLNRYDGYNFEVYKNDSENPNSLSDNWISSVYEDRAGALWIGTGDGGLNRYDRQGAAGLSAGRFSHYRNDPQVPNSLSEGEVSVIYEDRAGVLWVGTIGGGLNRFDAENERFIHYQHDPSNPRSLSSNVVTSINQDREGVLWIGTDRGGLNRWCDFLMWRCRTCPRHARVNSRDKNQKSTIRVPILQGRLERLAKT